ncbi:hypothetical protein NX875_29400, partial [Burkholderia thailandensis]|nr:hypothetical protein [Burkholderia thailandensis]
MAVERNAARRANVFSIDVDVERGRRDPPDATACPASLSDSAQTSMHIPAEPASGAASRMGARASRIAYRAPHAIAGTCAPRGIGLAPRPAAPAGAAVRGPSLRPWRFRATRRAAACDHPPPHAPAAGR